MARPRLSARETRVLRRTAEGASARMIGLELQISPKTVETYRQRGYAKMHLTRQNLLRYALKAGWFAMFLLAAPLQAQRTYWPVSVDSLATGKVLRTHVQTVGLVTLVRHESDGDIHLKLVGKTGFVVLEVIPGCPMKAIPTVGMHIRAYGITRWDGEHRWQELQPLEKWEPLP